MKPNVGCWCYQLACILAQLKPGDIVEFKRPTYSHWSVYIGKGKVIEANSAISPFKKSNIELRPIEEVMSGDPVRMNNYLDDVISEIDGFRSFDNEAVVARAKFYLTESDDDSIFTVNFSPISNNCEHFATMVRYGVPVSATVTLANDFVFESPLWQLEKLIPLKYSAPKPGLAALAQLKFAVTRDAVANKLQSWVPISVSASAEDCLRAL